MTEAAKQLHDYVSNLISLLSLNSQEPPLPSVSKDTLLKEVGMYHRLFVPFNKIKLKHPFRGKLGHCYEYAFKASMRDANLIYCEGLATPGGLNFAIPLEHAWCVHAETGEVVDPVWKGKKTGLAYYGIPMSNAFVREVLLKNKVYGVMTHTLTLRFGDFKLGDIVHEYFHKNLFNK